MLYNNLLNDTKKNLSMLSSVQVQIQLFINKNKNQLLTKNILFRNSIVRINFPLFILLLKCTNTHSP